MKIYYFLIALTATTIGSMTGLGGGIIIKPVLDALNQYDLSTISILSSATVFSMSVVALIKQISSGFAIERSMYLLGIGTVIGGMAGESIFQHMTGGISGNVVTAIQSSLLALMLIVILFKDKFKIKQTNNIFMKFVLGLMLGIISSFLGIGGGPLNVAALSIFLGFKLKDSAVISILIIFLSQLSKLLFIFINEGFYSYDLSMLKYMIPAAILGGLIGSRLNIKADLKHVDKIFSVTISMIILLCIYNAIKGVIHF